MTNEGELHEKELGLPEGGLSASEALFGFIGWLTSRNEPITMSSTHDAGEPAAF